MFGIRVYDYLRLLFVPLNLVSVGFPLTIHVFSLIRSLPFSTQDYHNKNYKICFFRVCEEHYVVLGVRRAKKA